MQIFNRRVIPDGPTAYNHATIWFDTVPYKSDQCQNLVTALKLVFNFPCASCGVSSLCFNITMLMLVVFNTAKNLSDHILRMYRYAEKKVYKCDSKTIYTFQYTYYITPYLLFVYIYMYTYIYIDR